MPSTINMIITAPGSHIFNQTLSPPIVIEQGLLHHSNFVWREDDENGKITELLKIISNSYCKGFRCCWPINHKYSSSALY